MRAALWLGIVTLAPGAAQAQGVAVNEMLAAIALEDQHGEPGGVDAATRGVLLSRDMDGGGLVREALATDGAAQLERAGAVYIADVHAMPGVGGAPSAALPSEEGKATWLRLEGLRVVEIRFLTSSKEVGRPSRPSPRGTESGIAPAR